MDAACDAPSRINVVVFSRLARHACFQFSGLSQAACAELLLAMCCAPLAAINFRLPCSPLVTASDASSSDCGVCRSVGLSLEGRAALLEFDRPLASSSLRIGIGELFAGIGGLRRSLELIGLSPDVSVVCEVAPSAVRVLLHQWPDSILWGDVTEVSCDRVLSLSRSSIPVDVWLVGGGFECQLFSGLNPARQDVSHPSGRLFEHINRIADLFQIVHPISSVFRFAENSSSMSTSVRHSITSELALPCYYACPSTVSPVSRPRLY